ncbi:MAG: hypothetical protein ACP5QO_03625 [Clostridia bacterium]
MKRTVTASRSAGQPGPAPTTGEAGLGQVMLLHQYRNRARVSRWLEASRQHTSHLRDRICLVPRAFWIGMLAGLLLGAVVLIATGHGSLFVQPAGHSRSGAIPSSFKSPA